jgi:DNA polymerase sigma
MPQTNGVSNNGCRFETALVNSRRRIPYSVGSEKLAPVPPESYSTRLDDKEERCLTVDMMDMYQVCRFDLLI